MKTFLKWLGRVTGGAISFILIVVLMPYFATFADYVLPDISGAHVRNAAILSQQMQQSARLETLIVTGEGAINAEVDALFLGTVSSVNATYTYTGSYGVDLSRVQVKISGSKLIFLLPQPELLSDSVELVDVYRDGSYDRAVRVDDKGLQSLLDAEKQKWREQYLTGEHADALRQASITAIESTIAQWMTGLNGRLQYEFQWAAPQAE